MIKFTGKKSCMAAAYAAAIAWALCISASQAATFTSNADGDWSASGTWNPATPVPDTGGTLTGADSVIIDGHAITFSSAGTGTFPGTGDMTVRNGNTVTIRNGGSIMQTPNTQHVRIGDGGAGTTSGVGTVNVEDGLFSIGTAAAIQIGIRGGNGTILVGDGVGAPGSAIFNGGTGGTQLRMNSSSSGGPVGDSTVIVESDGLISNFRPFVGYQGGTASLTVNGTGQVNTQVQNGGETIGHQNGSVGTVTLNDDATWTTNARDGLRIGNDNGSTGTMTLNDNSVLSLTRNQNSSARPLAVGYAGTGTLNINDNASVSMNHQLFVGRNATGRGTVNHNSGSLFTTRPIGIARINGAQGTYILTDGTVATPDRFDIGHDGQGTFIQNGGTASSPTVRLGVAATAGGTWDLNAGTLRANSIQAGLLGAGTLNWGGGTLTMYEVNAGAAGTTEYSTAPISGENIRSGTTIAVDGDLATGFGGGTSVLELGVLYKNSGTRSDILELTGALDLSGADQINAIGSSNLLRPVGGLIDYGTIPLVTAAGGITGEFDTYGDIFASGSFNFFESPFATSDPSTLKANSYYFETTGTQLLFHYKVTGTVPEPSTVSFLAIGLVFIRFVRWSVANKKRG